MRKKLNFLIIFLLKNFVNTKVCFNFAVFKVQQHKSNTNFINYKIFYRYGNQKQNNQTATKSERQKI